MDIIEIVAKNVSSLISIKGLNYSQIAKLAKENKDTPPIDKGYVAQIANGTGNVSLVKLTAIASVLGVEVWQLCHPSGFNVGGESNAIGTDINLDKMVKAAKYVLDIAKGIKITDDLFMAQAIAKAYEAQITGNESNLAIELINLSRKFQPEH